MTQTATKERGILMHARSVQNILAGRKTQTRRIIKPQPDGMVNNLPFWEGLGVKFTPGGMPTGYATPRCPYGQPGDRLWVRETWTQDERGGTEPNGEAAVYYRADMPDLNIWKGYWKPSLHMPRWASRITLEITDIRVERVQDISDADIEAEGVHVGKVAEALGRPWRDFPDLRSAWIALWDDTNGKGAWERNDWVWVVEFKVVTP